MSVYALNRVYENLVLWRYTQIAKREEAALRKGLDCMESETKEEFEKLAFETSIAMVPPTELSEEQRGKEDRIFCESFLQGLKPEKK